jgi:DinB superfamily
MKDAILNEVRELIRETFEGGLPGQGTRYLDHDSGIRRTLDALSAEQASRSIGGHPTIAAHARHMAFHMRAVADWVSGARKQRDWKGSFNPQQVNGAEWAVLRADLESARAELMRALERLSDEEFAKEGAGIGAVVHLAYHLGAIRQLVPLVQ